jgi:hypothetical protein
VCNDFVLSPDWSDECPKIFEAFLRATSLDVKGAVVQGHLLITYRHVPRRLCALRMQGNHHSTPQHEPLPTSNTST